jgi:hypothetical protein
MDRGACNTDCGNAAESSPPAGHARGVAQRGRHPLPDHRTPPEWVEDLAARFSALGIDAEASPAAIWVGISETTDLSKTGQRSRLSGTT